MDAISRRLAERESEIIKTSVLQHEEYQRQLLHNHLVIDHTLAVRDAEQRAMRQEVLEFKQRLADNDRSTDEPRARSYTQQERNTGIQLSGTESGHDREDEASPSPVRVPSTPLSPFDDVHP